MKALSLLLGVAAVARAGSDLDTRIATVIRARTDEQFETRFERLSETEQIELLRVLTTPMRAWPALRRLPTREEWDSATDARKNSFTNLLEWVAREPDARDPLDRYRFVSLEDDPVTVKLRFEKTGCADRETIAEVWAQRWRAWVRRFERRPTVETPVTCHDRRLEVSVAADFGEGNDLRDQSVLKTTTRTVEAALTGASWRKFRRRVWENLEIALSSMSKESALIPDRMRVVELAGSLSENEFLERRRRAALVRARRVSENPAYPQTTVQSAANILRE